MADEEQMGEVRKCSAGGPSALAIIQVSTPEKKVRHLAGLKMHRTARSVAGSVEGCATPS